MAATQAVGNFRQLGDSLDADCSLALRPTAEPIHSLIFDWLSRNYFQ